MSVEEDLWEKIACISVGPPGRVVENIVVEGCRKAELRLDLLAWDPREAAWAVEELSSRGVKVIVTLRDYREGGRYRGDDSVKLKMLTELVEKGAWLADVEYRYPLLDEALSSLEGKVMVSVHFTGWTPEAEVLYSYAGDMIRRGAVIAKIVGYASTLRDNWKLLGINVKWPGRVTSFAMGEAGRISRVVAPLIGGALTYVTLDKPSAPGQLTLTELLQAWRLLGVMPSHASSSGDEGS
ncbi:MAG: hypothetical protein DSY37_04325 [Hyperthermus sp.]|nr:MAG: hypothetical protein DSY37_04325 [Hyperthermus sp.]